MVFSSLAYSIIPTNDNLDMGETSPVKGSRPYFIVTFSPYLFNMRIGANLLGALELLLIQF